MAKVAVQRTFEVGVNPEEAWARLAQVERWPEWAPHITAVTLSDGPLGPSSRGVLKIRRLGKNAFAMSAWEPPRRWEWTGGLPGVRIVYDHRFAASEAGAATLTWVVSLHGPLTGVVAPVFARIYGRNLDRALPSLQEWIKG